MRPGYHSVLKLVILLDIMEIQQTNIKIFILSLIDINSHDLQPMRLYNKCDWVVQK